ncbi:tetratricopeptide repeat protein [Flavobacterium aquicola]|uniref:SH3 domain-containing protein n=1 Tax=Flavobacterium aquicola TaxID=1682742 RepID=A0A3E0EMU8_9FLAO|nr:tetratricopeptide repeat protein [Flavobacterium aquicola]REG99070.1 SH3 domain-containing protein [Flavobacterium aquicola]
MKNIFYILLLISQVFYAQTGFEKGNDLYKNGQYDLAAKEYESVLATNKESAQLYFNLGNCYYKLQQTALSIYNYEKALVLDPNNAAALNNIKFAQKRTVDEIKVIPKVGFGKLLRDFTGIYPFDTWAYIAVGFSVLFLVLFIGYYFSQTGLIKRLFFVGMFIVLLFMLMSVASAFFEKSHFENERPAIVFAQSADVRSEPQNASSSIFILHEGTKVYVEETLDNWKKIQLTDGTEGWIDSKAIKEVKN